MTDYSKLVEALRETATFEYTGKLLSKRECALENLAMDAAAAIEALQAQLPKRGEWVEENRRPRSSQFVCSECHRTAYDPQPTRDKAWRKRCRYAYCPNCGAKMEVQDGK